MVGRDMSATPEVKRSRITEELDYLNETMLEINNQISRLRYSITRIEFIQEEGASPVSNEKETSFNELTLQEKVTRLLREYRECLKMFCYLNEKLEERVV